MEDPPIVEVEKPELGELEDLDTSVELDVFVTSEELVGFDKNKV
jgi:hypothetical protein